MKYLFVMHGNIVQIGAAYVAASLREYGYEVSGVLVNGSEALRAAIVRSDADVVCLGALSKEYVRIKELISDIRKIEAETGKELTVILGGGLVTTEPVTVIKNIGADIGVIGQGEITIRELADALENKTALSDVAGVIFTDENGEAVITQARKELGSLDGLPFPAYDLFDIPAGYDFNIIASRSCPYRCTFCYHPSGSRYVQRSLDNIFAELDSYVKNYNIDSIVFSDELFANNEERVIEFCKRIEPYNLIFACQMRVDRITPTILDALYRAGCRTISLGLESADDIILKSMKKNITVKQIESAVELVYNKGINVRGSFIFGDVEEDAESIRNTLDWMKAHLKYPIIALRIIVFPGSELYNIALNRGVITDRLKYLEQGCPLINLSKATDKELDDAVLEARSYDYLRKANIAGIADLDTDGNCKVLYECYGCKERHISKEIRLGKDYYEECHCGIRNRLNTGLYNLKKHSATTNNLYFKQYDDIFVKLKAHYKRIAIYGAGEVTQILLLTSPTLRSCLTEIIAAESEKPAEELLGYRVVSPEGFNKQGSDVIFVSDAEDKDAVKRYLFRNSRIRTPII